MYVCTFNVPWSVSISAGTRARGRSRARAQGGARRAGAAARSAPGPGPDARSCDVSVHVIPSRERVAGAQGRISHRADCAYRLQYSETRDTPHTLSPAGRAFGLLFRLQRAVRGGPCGNAASAALLACA